jgi:hypothetical protein
MAFYGGFFMKKDLLKKKLFFIKRKMLLDIGAKSGKIECFSQDIIDRMDNTIIACFPVSLHMKYANFMFAQGTCYERSLYMFLALDDALLVRGNCLDLEYTYGPGHGGHGWVEIGDYVYDPATGYRYDKDLYYKANGVSNVTRCDRETYYKEHKEFVDTHVSTDFNEFKPGGKRRLELGILVRQVITGAELSNNQKLLKDLDTYLGKVEYDEEQIESQRRKEIDEMLRTEGALDVISGNCNIKI